MNGHNGVFSLSNRGTLINLTQLQNISATTKIEFTEETES